MSRSIAFFRQKTLSAAGQLYHWRRPAFVALCLLLCAGIAHAQTDGSSGQGPGFFIAPLLEITGYGREVATFGGGIALGMGNGVSGGLRTLYAKESGERSVEILEIAVFLRFYPFSDNVPTGFFFQTDGGVVIFSYKEALSTPADVFKAVVGITAGWRIPLNGRWYVEPTVRAGYPYIAGGGISVGYRF